MGAGSSELNDKVVVDAKQTDSVAVAGAGQSKPGADNSVFKLPEELQTRLAADHPDVLKEIATVGESWQAANTQKRMDEAGQVTQLELQVAEFKQKAEYLDGLSQDPGFTNYLVNRHRELSGEPPSVPASGSPDEPDVFSAFEDADAIKALASYIIENTNKQMDERLKPFVQDMAGNRENSEISSVKSFIAEQQSKGNNQYVDVGDDIIRLNMRKYNMSAMDAYRLAASNLVLSGGSSLMGAKSGSNIIGNPAGANDVNVGGLGQPAGQDATKADSSAALSAPGSGSVATYRKNAKGVDDLLREAASFNKKDGPKPESTMQALEGVLKLLNDTKGTSFTLRDL